MKVAIYLLGKEVPQDGNRTRREGIYKKISCFKVIRGLKPCNEMAKNIFVLSEYHSPAIHIHPVKCKNSYIHS